MDKKLSPFKLSFLFLSSASFFCKKIFIVDLPLGLDVNAVKSILHNQDTDTGRLLLRTGCNPFLTGFI